jgi:ubiquitin thioesterase protein OTUB1
MTRVMKGDGNCGWRGTRTKLTISLISQPRECHFTDLFVAVAFGYFETLFSLRDILRVEQELARIKSLTYTLDRVGYAEHLYEMFIDATEEVFLQTSEAIRNGDQDETFLVNAFNNEYQSNSILMHFRVRYASHSSDQLMADNFTAFDQRLDEAESRTLSSILVCSVGTILRLRD